MREQLNLLSLIFFFFLDRRDGETTVNSHTQSGSTMVRTPVMTSDLTISAFLLVELGLIGQYSIFTSWIENENIKSAFVLA